MNNIVKRNLSVQWGDSVDCAKLSTCGDDIVALLAVASYLDFDQWQFVIAMMTMMSIIFMHPGQKGGDVNDDAIYIYIVSTMRTIYLDPAVTVAVLDHNDQAGPTLEKIFGRGKNN